MADGDKSSKAVKWLIGCSIAMLVVVLACGGGAYWAWGAFVDYAHAGAVEGLEKSGLPEEQVSSMRDDLARLKEAVLDWEVDVSKLEGMEQNIEKLVSLGVIQWFDGHVVPDSELPEDEKVEASRTLQRLARGVQEETIGQQEALAILDIDTDNEGRVEEWDPEDLRIAIAKAKKLADDNEVPDEPFQVDVASEFSELIDELIETE